MIGYVFALPQTSYLDFAEEKDGKWDKGPRKGRKGTNVEGKEGGKGDKGIGKVRSGQVVA